MSTAELTQVDPPPGLSATVRRSVWPWLAASAMVLIGAYGIYERLSDGLRPTNLSSYVPWGLWAAAYEFLVWLEVGSLLVFSVLYYNFGWKKLAPVTRTVYLAGFIIMNMALVTIAMDLGQMTRVWRIFLTPDFSSPLAWMVWLHTIYMLILVVKIWAARTQNHAVGEMLHWVSLPMGIALVALAGGVFGIVAARPLWSMAHLPLHFLMASLLSGAALVALQVKLFAREFPQGAADELLTDLRKVILGLMIAAVLAALMTLVVLLVGHSPLYRDGLNLIFFGPYWWSYWILHILLGVLVPALLLVLWRTPTAVWVSALLIVAGFSALPPNIVIPGLASEQIAGMSAAYQDARLNLNYFPSANEWMVLVCITGSGWLAFLIGRRVSS